MARRALLAATVALIVGLQPGAALAQLERDVARGEELYLQSCASCHGEGGAGTERGPTLIGVGAASADFYLRTGRMPLANPGAQAFRGAPAFDDDEILALVRYVDSLGEGPPIPAVDISDVDLSRGQQLFIENCAACHGATGAGGAVGENAFAPSLHVARPVEVAEATIIGPGQMPRFAFSEDDRNDIVGYIEFLSESSDPGGADIGGTGPVSEGWVAWIVGMGALMLVAVLVGRTKKSKPAEVDV